MKRAGKTVWIIIDGGYTKRPFLRRALKTDVTIVSRLRKDAALKDLPPSAACGMYFSRDRLVGACDLEIFPSSFPELFEIIGLAEVVGCHFYTTTDS